ncbi:hypothetical protein QBK99_08510 [Corticibacterium sp. UT-5YL-CI-8]|nr:hypothetical protein [Tianweitania sp. UT-5YL-CI-8]
MFGLTQLHNIAAVRGDGLRPELLELFKQRQRREAGKVTILPIPGGGSQSGPNPFGTADSAAAANVLPFPAAQNTLTIGATTGNERKPHVHRHEPLQSPERNRGSL